MYVCVDFILWQCSNHHVVQEKVGNSFCMSYNINFSAHVSSHSLEEVLYLLLYLSDSKNQPN